MPRQKSTNVEYFPCYCKDGKTLYILESRWGNAGYAFFYKLWKRLGDADYHYIDLRPFDNWEYFRAKMGVSDAETQAILDKLAEMRVIDPELWSQKIIWSDSFVESIKEVWIKRKQIIPQKPLFLVQKPAILEQNDEQTGISGIQNTQSKVEESKEEKSKDISMSESEKVDSDGNGKYPPCSQQEIVSLYHKTLPELPRVKHWPENLQAILRTRWKEDPARQNLAWWEKFFLYVHESDFLMGRTKETFLVDLEWMIRPKNFTKIANGRYHRGRVGSLPQPGIAAWLEERQNA